ncbi:MAG: SDR family NAD(P)-dependent oxidoreductase [Acidimicrobiales bacterium]
MTQPLAVITGAGSGIGEAIAVTLAQRGHRVVVTDVDLASAERVADSIEGASAIQLDVTDPYRCTEVADEVVKRHGHLDVWVSNAGVSKMQCFLDVTPSDLARTIEVNTYGVFYCGQAAARAMIGLGTPGVIVNTASMAAKQGRVAFLSDYVASKFAVLGMTQSMAFELAPFGIRVNCVCPGYVATPMQGRELIWESELRGVSPADVTQLMLDDTPLARLESALDVAKVVAFLVSDDAAFLTGEAVSVNGGAFMD